MSRVRDGNGSTTHSITLFRDITLQREAQDRIQRLAHFDPLTDLPNRALLAERAQRHIEQEQARGGTLAMLFLDLGHFENVNDSLGHRIGDILLVAVARRLESLLGTQDTVSRLEGDEFLLLLPAASAIQAADVAQRLLIAVAQPFQVEHYELTTTLSVGIAMYPADGDSFDTLYLRADAAMSRAKLSGRTVSRLGGDEFILLLPGADARGAARVASKLQEASRQPYQIDHHELTMAPSMGIALFPQDGHDFDTLTQSADVAMYRAKLDGRNTFRFFTPEMQAQSVRALQLENALRRALEREQFQLHYQPQISLATGTVRSVEALLRWQHPQLGPVSPGEFIPIAEDSGQILQIGEWVLRTALTQLKAWRSCGFPELTMAVNLSAIQFRQPQLPELVSRVLEEFDLPPRFAGTGTDRRCGGGRPPCGRGDHGPVTCARGADVDGWTLAQATRHSASSSGSRSSS